MHPLISLVEASVCVTSGVPIATGKHIGDCDLVPSFDLSLELRAHTGAGRADDISEDTTSIGERGWECSKCIVCVVCS